MPNHCSNSIKLSKSAARKLIDEYFYQFKGEKSLNFNQFIPQPESETNPRVRRDWRIKHWGTDRNSYHCEIRELGEITIIRFLTAWYPPLPVVEAVANTLKESIEFEYFEPNCCICGRMQYERVGDEMALTMNVHLGSDNSPEEWGELGFEHPDAWMHRKTQDA